MTFLKLGHHYINPEMITDVFVQDRRPERPDVLAEVYLAAPTGEHSVSGAPASVATRSVHLTGEDALRLIDWLESRVEG